MIPDQEKMVRIKGILKDHPQGLTVGALSKYLGMNRNSVAKYVGILQASGQVELQHFGASKVVYLSQRVPLSAMLGFSSDFVLVLDSNFRVIIANNPLLAFIGMKREDVVGLNIHSISHKFFMPDYLGSYFSDSGALMEKATEFFYQENVRKYFFRVKMFESVFDDGTNGFTLIIEDITSEKESEHILAMNEARYRGIVQDQTEFIVRFDSDGRISFCNDSFSRHLKIPDERVIGTSFLNSVMPEDRDYVKGIFQSVSFSSPTCTYEHRVINETDEVQWQQWTVRGIFREGERPSEYQGVGRDISERRKAEQRISRYISEIKFLSSTVSDFMRIQSIPQLFDAVGDHLINLYPEAEAVILYSLDLLSDDVTVRTIRIQENTGGISTESANQMSYFINRLIPNLISDIIIYEDVKVLEPFLSDPGDSLVGSSGPSAGLKICGFIHKDELLGVAVISLKDIVTRYSDTLLLAYLQQAATAMKRCSAEEALIKKEELFRSIIEFSPLPVCIIAKDGRNLYLNPTFSQEFGYTLEDLPDMQDWFQNAFPDDPSRNHAISIWNMNHGYPGNGRADQQGLGIHCKNGSIKEIHFHRVALPDETEFVVFEDVTERAQARKTDRLLASIVKSTDDAIIAKTNEGIILSWNPAAERLYGYSEEEMIGRDIRILAPPDLVCEIDDILGKLSRGEHIDHYETRRRKKDGTFIDVSVTATPLTDDTNTIIGASSIIRDITARKADERLSEAEDMYRKFIESIGVGFYRSTGDPGGHFLWGNSSLARMLGYPSFHDLSGVTISDLFAESDGRNRLLGELKKHGFVKNHEVCLRKSDGEKIWVRVTALASFSESGDIFSISGIIEDITALKNTLLELEFLKTMISPHEQEPAERRHILEKAFHQTGVGLAVLGRDGSLQVWNDAFGKICNLKESKKSEEINLIMIISPEDRRKVSDALSKVKKTGVQIIYHQIMTPQGRKEVYTQLILFEEPGREAGSIAALITVQQDQEKIKKRGGVFR
jgi:PAS domain S-box-containing protein